MASTLQKILVVVVQVTLVFHLGVWLRRKHLNLRVEGLVELDAELDNLRLWNLQTRVDVF